MLSALWLTGWRLWSSGHTPFWSRASTSVPTAPASSAATGSQPAVEKPGAEMAAPPWVAPLPLVQSVVAALLCTSQPPLRVWSLAARAGAAGGWPGPRRSVRRARHVGPAGRR